MAMSADDYADDADSNFFDGLECIKRAFLLDETSKEMLVSTLEQWRALFNREIAFMQGCRGPTNG